MPAGPRVHGLDPVVGAFSTSPLASPYAALTEIFFCGCIASAVFGRVTVNTPLLKVASILSASMPSGTGNVRSNDP